MAATPDANARDSLPPLESPSAPDATLSGKAVASLILGLLALPLLVVAGLPALVLGWLSLRQINESDGRLWGRWFAIAGMVLGGLGTLLTVVGLLANVVLILQERAADLGCKYNLSRIGAAVKGSEQQNGHYPSAIIDNPALPADEPARHLSWCAAVLPFLEPPPNQPGPAPAAAPRQDKARMVYEQLDLERAWDAPENRAAVVTSLRWFRCPSDRSRPAPGTPGLTNYVGLAGVGPDAADLPASDPRAGFFGYHRRLTPRDLQERRGESATLMVTETVDEIGPWAQGGPATVRGFDPTRRPSGGPGWPFSSAHPGGFNVLFVDGSVVFYRDGIEPEKLQTLIEINVPGDGQ